MKLVREYPLVSGDNGAMGPGDKLPCPIVVCQLGSASVARTEVRIGEGVDGDVEEVKTRR
jgi:hypothetical protein